MNLFSMNRYTILLTVIILYACGILCWVFVDDGFNGLKFLSVYALFASLLFGWWVGHVYVISTEEERRTYKKSHIGIGFFLIIIMSMSFGLNQKIAILFFDIDGYAKELQQTQATMQGSNAGQLNRFSGSALHTVMFLQEDARYTFPIACNLLTADSCKYKRFSGKNFSIKYKNELGYPFKSYYLIYEIKSPGFYRGVNYHINLYNKNKKYVVLYLIFIVLASILIIFLIPVLMLSNNKPNPQ